MENTVTISKQEYIMLTRMAERIDTVDRLLESVDYVPEATLRAILGIPKAKGAAEDGEL